MMDKGKLTYVFPFYWGFFIDISHVIDVGYGKTQHQLITHLNDSMKDESWFIEDKKSDDRVWHMTDRKLYGGSTKLGTSFIGRRIKPNKIIEGGNCQLDILEIVFFYHEFGTGTARVTVDFMATNSIGYQEYDDIIRSRKIVNQVTDFINTFIAIDCKVLTESVKEFNIPLAIDSQYFRELISSESIQVAYRKALWEHVVYEITLDKETPIVDEDIADFHPLINSSHIEGAFEASLEETVHTYPGFGTSLIVTNANGVARDTSLLRTVEVAEYYYAATSLLDDLLFDKFITFSLHNIRTPKISAIQKDLEEIKTLSNLLEVFLFVLKDSMINLNAHAKLIWSSYEREWYYDPMVETLEEKSKILNEKYRDLLNELNEKRSQTLNRFVKIFTVFSILGPLIQFTQYANSINLFPTILGLPLGILIGGGVVIVGSLIALGTYIVKEIIKF